MGFFQKLHHMLQKKEDIEIPIKDTELPINQTDSVETISQKAEITEISHHEQANRTEFPVCADDLNKAELILLRYMDNTRISPDQITLPNYFTYEYGFKQEDAQRYLQLFLSLNLLVPMPFKQTIEKYTVAEIKEFLKTRDITVKGKKADQIEALYHNFTQKELNTAFPPKYYVLSETGKQLLQANLKEDDWINRYHNIDFEKEKAEIEKLIASVAYKNTILYSANPYPDIPKYVIGNLEIFICTVMYMKSCTNAKRLLHRVFDIEDTQHFVEKFTAVLHAEEELQVEKEAEEQFGESYKSYYEICSMEDESVCEQCAALNGKHFPTANAVIGVNYPPFVNCSSEHCRCFASFHVEARIET